MEKTLFVYETEKQRAGYDIVLGVDEAGRGPLAGPVVAGAVCFRMPEAELAQCAEWKWIRDSKQLSEKKREEVFQFIQDHAWVGVGIVSADTIDRVNILEATFLAMRQAVSSIKNQVSREEKEAGESQKIVVLVDGNMTIPNLSLDQEAIVGGDATVKVIAAASIIAKVTRDRMMVQYDATYPLYQFAKHKGYGTAVHMAALKRYGPCPIHRMSFKPVRKATIEGINQQLRGKRS